MFTGSGHRGTRAVGTAESSGAMDSTEWRLRPAAQWLSGSTPHRCHGRPRGAVGAPHGTSGGQRRSQDTPH